MRLRMMSRPRRSNRRKTTRRKSSGKRKSKRGKSAWIRACQAHGYMKKGSFKPVPKKGSAAYKEIRRTMENMK